METPSPPDWDEETRARADKLLGIMTALGARDAPSWVRSEISEDLPQLVRYLVLRRVWQMIGSVEGNAAFIRRIADDPRSQQDARLHPVVHAIQRVQAAGADLQDVGRIMRFHLIDAIHGVLYAIDEPYDPDSPVDDEVPGWELVETDAAGEPTGRNVGGLHESFHDVDPTGLEGRTE